MNNERKYYCNQSMKFNLDSMRTHLLNMRDEFRDGTLKGGVEICGRKVDFCTIDDLIDEVEDLLDKAVYGMVTGKEYGRIKAISEERQMLRYITCINAGMPEWKAAGAFTD